MKIGVCSGVFHDVELNKALDIFMELGMQGVEIYAGGPLEELRHIDAQALLGSNEKAKAYQKEFESRGLFISSVNCSGNPVHPDPGIANIHQEGFRRSVLIAEKLGIDKVVGFSGTPGGSKHDRTPNWVTCPWPDEHLEMLAYQWNDVLVPYWSRAAQFAKDHGVTKIAFEMHPGFSIYNPETLLKLRGLVGNMIGSNFDPSHLMWQGIDPALALLTLDDAVFSVHAKDVYVNEAYIKVNGVNDAKHYSEVKRRAWTFRTVGYGHGEEMWKRIISALATIGYNGTINIEHEDLFMSRREGLSKAVAFLKGLLIEQSPEEMWWA